MRKPEKIVKVQRRKQSTELPPDQLMLATECGHCGKHFTNPSEAAWHVADMHTKHEPG
jgi:hypothetical protein